MKKFKAIYLIWKKGAGAPRIPIGRIVDNSYGITFRYFKSKVEEAKKDGFQNYAGFPDIDKVYKENVEAILASRLVQSDRNDLRKFYEFWQIDNPRNCSTLDILAFTGGLNSIDNFEFIADFYPKKGLRFISEMVGLKYHGATKDNIYVGQQLSYSRDSNNKYDKYAVELSFNKVKLGYVKMIHSKLLFTSKYKLNVSVHHIEKNGKLNKVYILISST